MRDFSFDTHIFKEGDTYVAYVPALDVSSCGATSEEARRNIRDAVRGFLAASADMGTLDEILKEAGYQQEGDDWRPPEFVSMVQSRLQCPEIERLFDECLEERRRDVIRCSLTLDAYWRERGGFQEDTAI